MPISFVAFVRQATLTKNRLSKIKSKLIPLIAIAEMNHEQRAQVSLYLEDAKKSFKDFETTLNKVIASESDDFDETQFYSIQEELSELLIEIQVMAKPFVSARPEQATAQNNGSTVVKLPPLALKTFDGSIEQWLPFSSLFEATVNENQSLSNIERFQYLLSSVQGSALKLIQNIPLTNSNFEVAWNILYQRYHNDRKLLSFHLNGILDLPNVASSVKPLRSFLSCYEEHAQALNALQHDITKESSLLCTVLLRKLDSELRRKFEDSREDCKLLPEVKELFKFLEDECSHLEAVGFSQNTNKRESTFVPYTQRPNPKLSSRPSRTVLLSKSTRPDQCIFCEKPDHAVYRCSEFRNVSPQDRLSFIQKQRCCTNCLSRSHQSRDCRSKYVCTHCKKHHHSLLHLTKPSTEDTPSSSQDPKEIKPTVADNTGNSVVCVSHYPSTTILLGTCLTKLTSSDGHCLVVRAIVDSASMVTCITEKCAQLLHLNRLNTGRGNSSIDGLSSQPVKTKGVTKLDISSLDGVCIARDHPVMILDKITSDLPQSRIPIEVREKYTNLPLADSRFFEPGPIDLLLDAGLFSKIITGDRIVLGNDLPVAVNSILGYLLVGTTPTVQSSPPAHSGIVTLLSTADLDLDRTLKRFWILEEPPPANKCLPFDEVCETYFRTSHERSNTGRYTVRLPFKDSYPMLGNSSENAKNRFLSLEKRLCNNADLRTKYIEGMNDYLKQGHMEPFKGELPEDSKSFYLPHHAVLKDESSSTKLRIVFDASARSSTSVSLNDILYAGPKLQNNICDVLLHFRRYPVVFSSDIKKMFRQIFIHPDDRQYLLLFWRENPLAPLRVYNLNTVTFGVNCSPYLAIRTLQQLIEDEGDKYPLAADALKQQVYIDDLILGAGDLKSALTLQQDIINLLSKGSFELRKWTSNCSELTGAVPEEHRETPVYFQDSDQWLFNVLGIKWLPDSDSFSYRMQLTPTPLTKRGVLSALGKIYDPCGWLTPVTFWVKLLVQQLWALGFQWDEPLPHDLSEKWQEFISELPHLDTILIQRYLHLHHAVDVQLHGFCDASEGGFSSVVYLRCVTSDNQVFVQLLMGKSRVAPLKKVSLPRLELCGAHLLAKLLDYCNSFFSAHYKITIIRAWCDSTVALAWIQTPPYKLKTFVANRVSEIQDCVPPHLWSHVPTNVNPADCASRGLLPSKLTNHDLWWTGPPWLGSAPEFWPVSHKAHCKIDILQEIKSEPFPNLVTTCSNSTEMFSKFSSWSALQRIMAYVIRFVRKLKKEVVDNGALKLSELQHSTILICKIIQGDNFSEELSHLRTNKVCKSRLSRLSPFIDEEGLIRVGGRIRNSNLPYAAKHPIVLPKSHHVVNLIIEFYHKKYLHAGPQLLQAALSRQFWILSSRSAIRKQLFKCIKCFRCRPRNVAQKMGDLPKPRLTPSRPFDNCGTDYLGPFSVKAHSLRKSTVMKSYICLFICFAVKAVHLEVVTDLTTEAYLAALTRFISRRGLPSNIFSDQATNYVGASSELQKTIKGFLHNEEVKKSIEEFALQNQLKFHFLPPSAPQQGGLWERAVRSVKHHLRRVIGDQILTLEEFNTLVIRIEAILNSRPLTPLSSDPNELDCLTPGHFLVGGPLLALPEPDWKEVPSNRLSRWQLVQSITQRLWYRWNTEYLHTLQVRNKWTDPKVNLKIGELVLIHDPNSPPLSWKMGRITGTSPGADGLVRVVHIRTAKGSLTRPITKVSPLPIED